MSNQQIKLELIDTEAGTQTRARINQEVVTEYAEAMKKGAAFPAVIVFFDGSKYLLADGFHRIAAAKLNGAAEILAEIREGSRTDAIKFALAANTTNGMRRTSADKRKCVIIALIEFPDLSNRAIADQCGVSDMLVKDVREEHVPDSGSSVRIGKSGKKYRMKQGKPRTAKGHKNGATIQVQRVKGLFSTAKPEARGLLESSIFALSRPVIVTSKKALRVQFAAWFKNRVTEQKKAA